MEERSTTFYAASRFKTSSQKFLQTLRNLPAAADYLAFP
ncbi:hypothetical protein SLEP1_g59284 [Rubroshorea leprosula]|uniref:Uncharacterized protein n=1 Tax=Rubroshorea leprosula TaxID=152421 RepID=A0AAV5MTE6_9ROSI|nr:hypothetical protein SLEP1_g59284 [Rubroshorea leprosula]